jgi:hypothetical protein
MDIKKFIPLLEKMDKARVPLDMRRSLTIQQSGPDLLEPLMDQSLDPGDAQQVADSVFEKVKESKELGAYIKTRKAINKEWIAMLQELEKATDKDWEAVAREELAATTRNDIVALAKQKRIKINL